MNRAQKSLLIRFITDTAKAEKNVERLEAKINRVAGRGVTGVNASRPMESVLKQTANLSAATGGLIPNLAGMGSGLMGLAGPGAVAAAAIGGVALGISKMVSSGIAAEDAITKMEVLFGGDRLKAIETYQKSIKFANQTPFDPADVVPAAVLSAQYGMDAFEKTLGKNKDKTLAALIGDMAEFASQEGNPVSMADAANALFRADMSLLDKYGKLGRDAYEQAKSAGNVGTDAFRKAFIQNMAAVKEWDGMALRTSKDVSGMWSTIVGNISTAFLYMSGAAEGDKTVTFWSQYRDIVRDITAGSEVMLEELKPMLVEAGATFGAMLKSGWESAKAMFTVMGPFLKMMWEVAKAGLRGVMFSARLFWNIISNTMKAISFVASTIYGWIAKSTTLNNMIKGMMGWLENMGLQVMIILDFLSIWWDGFLEKAKRTFEKLPETIVDAFTRAWEAMKELPAVKFLMENPFALIPGAQVGVMAYRAVTGNDTSQAPARANIQPAGVNNQQSINSNTTNNRNSNVQTQVNVTVQTPSQARALVQQGNLSGAAR